MSASNSTATSWNEFYNLNKEDGGDMGAKGQKLYAVKEKRVLIAPIHIFGKKMDVIFDTGASNSVIGINIVDKLRSETNEELKINDKECETFYGVPSSVRSFGTTILNIKVLNRSENWKFAVIPGSRIILGMDIMRKLNIKLDIGRMYIKIGNGKNGNIMHLSPKLGINKLLVKLDEDYIVESRTICSVRIVVDSLCTSTLFFESAKSDYFPNTVVRVKEGIGLLSVINPMRSKLIIKKGTPIGYANKDFEILARVSDDKCYTKEHKSIFSYWINDELANMMDKNNDSMKSNNSKNSNNILDKNSIKENKQKEETNDGNEYFIKKLSERLVTENLNDTQREELLNLITKYKEIFSDKLINGGLVDKFPCRIKVRDGVEPTWIRRYNYSDTEHERIDKEVDELYKAHVIEDSVSPWESPVVIVRKKDGNDRFCIDFRKVNMLVEKDVYPLPNIDLVLRSFNGCNHFTKMDFTSGFFQIKINENDRPVTAFATRRGKFQFTSLPQGFINSSSIFQRTMNLILSGLSWEYLLVYIDDILIFSRSFEEHLIHLENVFKKLKEYKLVVKLSKCEFAKDELLFLGHIINSKGICADPKKVSVIRNCAIPTTHSELHSFLGGTGYYRKFIMKYTDLTKPLRNLLNSKEWYWNKETNDTFDLLKEKLCTSPVLAHPDPTQPYTLHCDASGYAVGIVLEQNGHPIHFYSKRLTKTESHFGSSERECLALVTGVKKFRNYLYGKPFTVVTDHDALRYLFQNRDHVGRLMRWSLSLQEYAQDMCITYKPGRLHSVPDALSRLPFAHNSHKLKSWFDKFDTNTHETLSFINHIDSNSEDEDNIPINNDTNSDNNNSDNDDSIMIKGDFKNTPRDKEFKQRKSQDKKEVENDRLNNKKIKEILNKTIKNNQVNKNNNTQINENNEEMMEDENWENKSIIELNEIGKLQLMDVECGPIVQYFIYGKLPVNDFKNVLRTAKECVIENGQLFKVEWKYGECVKCLWLPECMIDEILCELHGTVMGGHSGFERTLMKVRERFYFIGMYTRVKNYVQKCQDCQRKSGLNRKEYNTMHPLQHPSYPFERISMDIVGPLIESEKGNKYILTVMDYFSRWPEAIAIPNVKASTVAEAYIDIVLSRFGCPRILLTDLGSQFTSAVMKEVNSILLTQHRTTSAYRPQTNGMIERFHKSLSLALSHLISISQKDWDDFIPMALFVFRSTNNATIGMSPFRALYGISPSLPQDVTLNLPKECNDVEERLNTLRQLRVNIPIIVNYHQEAMKDKYESNPNHQFEQGDPVWLKIDAIKKNKSKKFLNKYSGPFIVLNRTSENNYSIRHALTGVIKKVHVSKLKKAYLTTKDLETFKEDMNEKDNEKKEKENKKKDKDKTDGYNENSNDSSSDSNNERIVEKKLKAKKNKKKKENDKGKEKDSDLESENYQIEEILDHRDIDDGRYYLIKWEEFNERQDGIQWLHEKRLDNCDEILEKYLSKSKNKEKRTDVKFKIKKEQTRWNKRQGKD